MKALFLLSLLSLLVWQAFANAPSKKEDFYETLQLKRSEATPEAIKKAYKRLALKYHPDKNKDDPDAHQKFHAVSQAYEVLNDEKMKDIYDKYGHEGVERTASGGNAGGHGFHDAADIFAQFFGGSGGGFRGKPRGHDVVIALSATLSDLYMGKSVVASLQKQSICSVCSGSGAKDANDVQTCPSCNGRGVRLIRHEIGMGFVQQVQVQCDKCGGKGKIIKTPCSACSGRKVVRGEKQITIEIEKGMPDGHIIIFEGEGDEHPDIEAGDVGFKIETKAHPIFTRQKSNLYTKFTLTLQEALFGFSKKIKHLDDSDVLLERSAVTQPGFVQVLEGLGFQRWDGVGKGNLYVEYQVVLPTKVTPELKESLKGHFEL